MINTHTHTHIHTHTHTQTNIHTHTHTHAHIHTHTKLDVYNHIKRGEGMPPVEFRDWQPPPPHKKKTVSIECYGNVNET